jgi:hypothetical protein
MNKSLQSYTVAVLILGLGTSSAPAREVVPASTTIGRPACASRPQDMPWRSTGSGLVAEVDVEPLRGRRVWIRATSDGEHSEAVDVSLLLAFDVKPDGTMLFGQSGQLFAPPHEAATTTLTSWVGNDVSQLEVRLPPSARDVGKRIRLPMQCASEQSTFGAPSDQQALLDEALGLYLTNAIKAPSDSSKIRRQAQEWATGAEEPNDVVWALRAVLYNLGDHHSYLVQHAERSAFFAMLAPHPPDVHVRPDGIAIVRVSQVAFEDERSGMIYARALAKAVSRAASMRPRGWIVDLRQFGGGNMWIVLAGLSHLVDGPFVGEFVSRNDRTPWLVSAGRAGTVEVPSIVSTGRAHPDVVAGPVAVLIGPGTGSSGESTTVAFEGRPRTRVFGQPTLGLYDSGVTQFTLSDGTMFGIANTRFADRQGRVYEGPIEPDELVKSNEDAQVVAVQWLLRQSDVSNSSGRPKLD